ncbi:succinylglutamate-semialdehyde dehydrogenase [Hahella ganghwensis]|uniref:succinylglutamate-semialdehyde dehydrogenase n=1 Tax=Hahella ganghwensis TaxID=286420 RepID=UPI0003649F93|nr:succinylglutamate-semialdehyde dehydrogenase [Hahella ganghwensis]
MTEQHSYFINGHWGNSEGQVVESLNPVTQELLWSAPATMEKDVNHAVESARAAFRQWSRKTLEDRLVIVRRFAELLGEQKETLADLIGRETSKPLWESRTEIAAMIAKVEISVQAHAERTGRKEQDVAAGHAVLRHRPHGVLAVFGPYNFPGHLPNGHIVPALIAGNTIVFKPSELTPAFAQATVQVWEQAGLPDGVLNLVQGAKETGIDLACHPMIDGLLFTGSSNTGHAIHAQMGGHPEKIMALEMGGNNPLLVFPPYDLKGAVHHTLFSAFVSAGQRCTCARRVIVPVGSEGDEFVRELVKATDALKVGAYDDESQPFMGGVISLDAKKQLLEAQRHLEDIGGRVLLPLKSIDDQSSLLKPGIIDVTAVENLPDQEYFGPLLQIQRCRDYDHGVRLANQTRFGLAAGIITHQRKFYEKFLLDSRAGIVNWNKPLTGASSAAPFGGIGASGNHRPSAYYAADYCAYPVASLEAEEVEAPGTLSPGMKL